MTVATINAFESTIQTTNEWLDDLGQLLGAGDRQEAYRAMRGVLMALRDRMTVEEATDLGAQLPMLVRGFYYEGWNPAKTPSRERTMEDFLNHVREFLDDLPADSAARDAERSARAVFKTLEKHITPGEVEDVKSNLPSGVRTLWG